MGLGSILPVSLINWCIFQLATLLWTWRITDLGAGILGWAVAMVCWDFLYYWEHRIGHEVRVLWASHVNHHSSEHYDLLTALRQPWSPWPAILLYPPLALLGVRPELILMSGGFNLIYQFWIHTEAIDRMPAWFEAVFNTPSHHRVHHGSNPRYLDRNYGGILSVWDRLVGSFTAEEEKVVYGLTKNIHTFNLLQIAFHEYIALARDVWQTPGLGNRLNLLLRPPGWRPQ
jgi:sterol desaturase/sphingolipid hydroxylase (fatty acid hydroxylase superfamily)